VDVKLREFGPDDRASIDAFVAVDNASHVDAPWEHEFTAHRLEMRMRHAWDGEPGRYFLVRAGDQVVGTARLHISVTDNLHFAYIGATVHPDLRRRGYGTAAYDQLLAMAREMGRSTFGTDGWDNECTRGFAAARAWEQRSVAVPRRQHLRELEPGLADRLYDEALEHAGEYELQRMAGRTPDELLEPLAMATAAINDAPLDDLDLEDEVFSAARVAAYEQSQIDSGRRFYRILARHRATGEIAGVTVVLVEGEDPRIGYQDDTSVVRAHRGHRLGLLLKADMMRWLADVEPQLETVDTWNTESNHHMIAVNERLGYRAMGRELQFQRRVAG
jgi:RimJ/RimL family protein N-acetyltransferase